LTEATEGGTGNSAILSYQLYWDNGLGGEVDILVEESLAVSKTITGLD
jgi:hypothetical protein